MSPKPKTHKTLVHLTPALKRAIVADAEARGVNMTDLIVSKLADRFGVAFEPSEVTATRQLNPDQLAAHIRMPWQLYLKIRAAGAPPNSISGVIAGVLADEYAEAA